jgi:hypothetical protein
MSNQIVISSGAKVRSLEGVLTGTAGIVNSVPLGGANGVATLDSSGKVPLSQLPASVITYLGTWNAATNTPTLVNGTGDDGDLYICNVAGTVNFGAGPITFAVGDWVIYGSGTWQKSAGASGTVTSVALSNSGDALSITGSPITTSGTINIGFAGTGSQYVKGDGTLATFPTTIEQAQKLITEVYNSTGYTLSKGTIVYINGGQGNLPTVTPALATSDATSAQTYGVVQSDITNNNNGYVVVIGSLSDLDTSAYANGTQLYLSGTTAGAWTSTKPSAPIHLVYVAVVVRSHPTQGVVEIRIQNGYELEELHDVAISSPSNNQGIFYNSSTSLWENKSIATALGYTPANAATYVPYTGATTQVDLGSNNLYGKSLNVWGDGTNGGGLNLKQYTSQSFLAGYGYTALYTDTSYGFGIWFLNGASTTRQINFNASLLANNTGQTYYLPAATGTIALTSDIPSLTNYVTLNTAQTITGIKTFTNEQLFGNGITLTGGYITYTSGSYNLTLNTNILTANRNVFLQDKAGTIALTSDIPSLSGYVQGTGTTNYHAKFTASATIGNSMLSDDGTTLTSAGATRSNLYLKATSNSYYSQLAFTNGTNASYGGISYNNSGQYMQFETNSSEWARLNSNGNFLIGTTSDNGSKLQVTGAATITGNLGVGGGANERLTITGPSGLAGMARWTDATTGSGFLGFTSGGTAYIHSNNNALAFGANGSNNFAATMTLTSGNVGIGTGNPAGKLAVLAGTYQHLIYKAESTYQSSLRFNEENNGARFYTDAGTEEFRMQQQYASTGFLTFYTGTTERMRITSGGSVCINRTSGSGELNVQGTIYLYLTSSGAGNSTLKYNTSTGAVTYDTSARIYKKDITDLEYGLDAVLKMSSKKYKWKSNDANDLGFIADEMYQVVPEVVYLADNSINKTELEDGEPMGINYDRLVPVLVKAIQELNAKVTALENK